MADFSAIPWIAEHIQLYRSDPETVIEVARFILNGPRASSRLRKLAGLWDERESEGNPLELVSDG